MSMESEKRRISNRVALTVAGVALAVAGLGIAKSCSAEQKPESSPSPSHGPIFTPEASAALPTAVISPIPTVAEITPIPTASENAGVKEGFISLGSEIDLSLRNENLIYTPDGHIPYISFSDESRRYFITASVSTYLIETNGESLRDAIQKGHVENRITKVYGPEQNQGFEYAGITSVFQLDEHNENHLTAILHEEERMSADDIHGVKASVAKVESFDGGLTWTNKQVLIWGANPGEPGGPSYSGAGQPNAIQIGEYLYVYYIDWTQGQEADQIYLARTKIANGTIDGNMEFYSNGSFDASKEKEHAAVIPAVDGYSALPSVSFNTYLNQYLCVFETAEGFAQTTSIDGINWSEPVYFATFGSGFNTYTYPTFISDEMPNDNVTSATGILYYAKGAGAESHNLVARPFEIK